METESTPPLGSRRAGLLLVAAMVAVMWALEAADLLGAGLDDNGIRPRDPGALDGIAFAPFLHAGVGHLIANTVPFLVLGATIALRGLARIATVTVIVAVVGGLGTWLTASAGTLHIGASGLVFGFAAYLVGRGISSRRFVDLAVGLVVLALFGTTLLFGLVPTPGVSWQSHLFGAIGGLVAARVMDRRREAPTALATRAAGL